MLKNGYASSFGKMEVPTAFFSCCTMCKSVNSRGTAIKPDLMMQLINAAAENDATLASQESCWTRKKQTLDVAQTGREASHSRARVKTVSLWSLQDPTGKRSQKGV